MPSRPLLRTPPSPWSGLRLGRSGLPLAFAGFAAAFVLSAIVGGAVFAAGDWDVDTAPIWVLAILQLPLWAGLLGAVAFASRRRGTGSVWADFALRPTARDLLVGLVAGIGSQVLVSTVVAWPVLQLTGKSSRDYDEPARKLADTAHASSWWGIALFVVMVVVGAPLVEELFYRGLLQRGLADRAISPLVVVPVTALLFGLSHFQALQLPALVLFGLVLGLLAWRTGRLGPSWATHAVFNATAAITMIWQAAHR